MAMMYVPGARPANRNLPALSVVVERRSDLNPVSAGSSSNRPGINPTSAYQRCAYGVFGSSTTTLPATTESASLPATRPSMTAVPDARNGAYSPGERDGGIGGGEPGSSCGTAQPATSKATTPARC